MPPVKYFERVIVPQLIDNGLIDQKPIHQAVSIVMKTLYVRARRARQILEQLEKRGYIRKEPARIVIIKKEANPNVPL
jgi:hypothetical protein